MSRSLLIQCLNATALNKMIIELTKGGKMYKRGPLGAAAAMCTRLLDLRMKAPSQSMLPRIDKEADDGRFAKRLSGLQPVQTLNDCRPLSRMLAAISSTRFCSRVARRLIGT